MYSGIHYDALALTPGPSFPPDCDITRFDPKDSLAELEVKNLAGEARERHQYTDLAHFTLKCSSCNKALIGERRMPGSMPRTLGTLILSSLIKLDTRSSCPLATNQSLSGSITFRFILSYKVSTNDTRFNHLTDELLYIMSVFISNDALLFLLIFKCYCITSVQFLAPQTHPTFPHLQQSLSQTSEIPSSNVLTLDQSLQT